MRRSWSSLSKQSVLDVSGVVQGSTQVAVGQPTSRVPECIGGKMSTDDLWDELVLDSGSVSTHVHMLGVRTSV